MIKIEVKGFGTIMVELDKEAAPKTVENSGNFWGDLIYGLKPSVIKENSKLYLTLLALCAYSIAVQVFFPYLIIYLQHSPDEFFSGE